MGLCLSPVLHLQRKSKVYDTLVVLGVVGHKNASISNGGRRDERVVWADGLTGLEQCAHDASGENRLFAVDGKDFEGLDLFEEVL
jgi:hypothetical protein